MLANDDNDAETLRFLFALAPLLQGEADALPATEAGAKRLLDDLTRDTVATHEDLQRQGRVIAGIHEGLTSRSGRVAQGIQAVKERSRTTEELRGTLMTEWQALGPGGEFTTRVERILSHPTGRLGERKVPKVWEAVRGTRGDFAEKIGGVAAVESQKKPLREIRQKLRDLTNEYRTKQNVSALTLDDRLNRAAQLHAVYLATLAAVPEGREAHVGERRSTETARAGVEGYRGAAVVTENVGHWQKTPEAIVQGWINSQKGHRENLVDPAHRKVGFGYAIGTEGKHIWVQVLGAEPT